MILNLEIFDDVSRGDSRKWLLFKQVLATAASCLIAVSNGLSHGISSAMLPQLRNDTSIHLDSSSESWIPSISVISMVIGSLGSGPLLDHYGRKLAHIFLGIPIVIGWIVIAYANSTAAIIIGRFITGLSGGANKSVTMVYIGEISDPRIRATTLFGPGLMTPIGIWISHVATYYWGWRNCSLIFVVPGVISLIAFMFLRESPIWLISKGKTGEGIENFRWFRGTDEKSEAELKSMLEKYSKITEVATNDILKVVSSKVFLKPMLILLVVMCTVQISGINAITYYSQDIFEKAFSKTIDPFIVTMAIDAIRCFTCLIICIIGDLVPRKLTFLITNFGVTLFSYGLAMCFGLKFNNVTWLWILCLAVYVICSTTGISVGFTFVPELLPTVGRGLGSGLNSTFTYIILFVVIKTLPDTMQKFDAAGLFIYFGTGTLICGLILTFVLLDTNGKTLQSIENSFDKKESTYYKKMLSPYLHDE